MCSRKKKKKIAIFHKNNLTEWDFSPFLHCFSEIECMGRGWVHSTLPSPLVAHFTFAAALDIFFSPSCRSRVFCRNGEKNNLFISEIWTSFGRILSTLPSVTDDEIPSSAREHCKAGHLSKSDVLRSAHIYRSTVIVSTVCKCKWPWATRHHNVKCWCSGSSVTHR